MTSYIQSNYIVTLSALAAPTVNAYTVLESDSGKTLLIPAQTQTFAIALPAPKMGLHYRFQAIGTIAFAATITATGAVMTGSLFNFTVVGVPVFTPVVKAAAASVIFNAAAVAGDWCDINCNGSVWYVSGVGAAVSFA